MFVCRRKKKKQNSYRPIIRKPVTYGRQKMNNNKKTSDLGQAENEFPRRYPHPNFWNLYVTCSILEAPGTNPFLCCSSFQRLLLFPDSQPFLYVQSQGCCIPLNILWASLVFQLLKNLLGGDQGSIPGSGRSPWRRKWQPSPVFLPGESHGQRSLAGNSPWSRKSQTWLSN